MNPDTRTPLAALLGVPALLVAASARDPATGKARGRGAATNGGALVAIDSFLGGAAPWTRRGSVKPLGQAVVSIDPCL